MRLSGESLDDHHMRGHSMTTTFFRLCLIMGSCLFIFTAVIVKGADVLIFDESRTYHVVFAFKDSASGPVQKKLVENVSEFAISRTGVFVTKDVTNGWYKGRVDSSLAVTKQALNSVPGSKPSISDDGRRIVWSGSPGFVVEEYNGDEPAVLFKISTKGAVISPAALSPDGSKIAYYSGPPDAWMTDGFSLMLSNVSSSSNEPMSIAGPSLWTRLSPIRPDPPIWAPDGQSILFEARYSADVFKTWYVVSVDGKRLLPSPFGYWDQEGKHLHIFHPEKHGSNRWLVDEGDVMREGNVHTMHNLQLPDRIWSCTVSPSAKTIVYIRDRQIYMYDTVTKQTTSYGICDFQGKLTWINPSGH